MGVMSTSILCIKRTFRGQGSSMMALGSLARVCFLLWLRHVS
jgi:hypothetical protein